MHIIYIARGDDDNEVWELCLEVLAKGFTPRVIEVN